jgi:hypothetical protein
MTFRLAAVAALLLMLSRGAGAGWPGAAPEGAAVADGPRADAGVTRPLPFLYDLYSFRGDGGQTLLVAAYAVEAGELEREHVDGAVRYRFDVSLVLADTARRTVLGRHDSVYVDLRRPLPSQHLLFTTIELQAPPSATSVQRLYMYNATAPGIGQLYMTSQEIPDYRGTALMLSDIALGQPDAALGWQRGAATLALLPTRQFPSSAFDVYYEIYNLPGGHEYVTEIAVAEVRDDAVADAPFVRLSFTGEAAESDRTALPELRRVETSLGPGRYRITVTITDSGTGRSASRSRNFEVHAGRAGATMVPALPVAASGG